MKFARGLALVLSLAAVSSVRGEIEIQLVCPGSEAEGACCFSPGAGTVIVDVFLRDTNAATAGNPDAMLLRLIQFDLNATDPALTVAVAPGPPGNMRPGPFWDFVSTAACPSSGLIDPCLEQGYLIDGSLSGGPAGEKRLAVAFGDSDKLGPLPANQLKATTDGVRVGRLLVTPPGEEGQWMFDLMNAKDSHRDNGAQIHFGFGTNINSEAITRWRASDSTPMITGGSIIFEVSSECEAAGQVVLMETTPTCSETNGSGSGTWWRSANNFALFTFSGDITAPAAGQVQIRQLQAGGAFGPDISADFTFTVENDGGGDPRILRIRENGDSANVNHRTWYGITNNGWPGVADFQVNYVVQIGDVNGDGQVLSGDISFINEGNPCFNCPDDRRDINGDDRILSGDVSFVNDRNPSFRVNIPSEHTCVLGPLP